MKKIRFLLIAFLICAGAGLYAADASVTFVSGKVEVQRGTKWVPLQKGDTLAKSDTISTGFQSEAKIKLMDSVLYLGPVTRITLEELATKGNTDNVNVYLKTGAARSQVKHVDNKRVNYQVHTAVAVASCRGTDWIIDSNNVISCLEGIVAVSAYTPPADDNDEEVSEDKKEEDSEDSSDESNEKDGKDKSKDGEEETDSDDEDGDSEEAASLSSGDGILLTANYTLQVSDDGVVSAPVNTVVKNANNIITSVTTAATQDVVSPAVTVTPENPVVKPPVTEQTGTVIVTLELN